MTNWIKVALGVALAGAVVAGGGSALTAITKAKGEKTEAEHDENDGISDVPVENDENDDTEVIDVTETSAETEV